MIRVPVSRFRRELRKWLRVAETEDIMITVRGEDKFVMVGYDRYNEMQEFIVNHEQSLKG